MNRLQKAILAVRELGLEKVSLFVLYRLGLTTGLWRRLTPPADWPDLSEFTISTRPVFQIPDQNDLSALLSHSDQQSLLAEANQIVNGQIRFFSAASYPLDLSPANTELHWTQIRDDDPHHDIKFIWEPARFGWVFTLGRAYWLHPNPAYPKAFWQYFHQFQHANPLNMGPNWASGQEVALRLMALIFAWQVFGAESTPEDRDALLAAISAHAWRIPPTLIYACAQNNNHLISEAAGLYVAGVFLQGHPQASRWRALGWKWLNRAWQTQIEADGTYVQQSSNYHRLMLQVSLVAYAAAIANGDVLPTSSRARLQAATMWVASLMDQDTGALPNLGHNDGSLFLPLSSTQYRDYHPTLQAAARAFLQRSTLPRGIWDELSLWLLPPDEQTENQVISSSCPTRINGQESWAVLRAARFSDRPAHADQMHVDLWFQGQNVALDAGTFRYTAPAPWDHPLARTAAHNTLTIQDQEQMLRASRFLWLRWAQATVHANNEPDSVSASHNGYAHLGITHTRSLHLTGKDEWRVTDLLTTKSNHPPYSVALHWLLPDLPWTLNQNVLEIRLEKASLRLTVQAYDLQNLPTSPEFQLIRAGELVYGKGSCPPYLGWVSPTYSQREPALSLRALTTTPPVVKFVSHWMFTY